MRTRPTLSWTPGDRALPEPGDSVDPVERVLRDGRVLVLSGAGLSTESGIPDYRGEGGTLRRHTPMTYQDFVGGEDARRRYWARSHLGWRSIGAARPNAGHLAVAALARHGCVTGVITQNVDGLHQAAGSRGVVELHGSLARVVCLSCGATGARAELDRRLRLANPEFAATAIRINPDGDADLPDALVRTFRTVPCAACGDGTLKPDVVFFGENVPRARVDACYRLVDEAAALLVLGSSLTVLSGLRFVRHAARAGTPVFVINRGVTRGDEHAALRVDLPLGEALTELARRLGAPLGAPEG
ncbi:NAD-dependent protein deacetylase [Streptacidiphilus sp. MAP12-33]|uniref:NAD-dependent protein deacetylase n=1 Tax=Streptacidiphilus sp. MAP12-33 TaxID=3156266 RepID=UPI0035136618